ncbi:MAG: cytochrome c [Bdellovibrionales bacterium]
MKIFLLGLLVSLVGCQDKTKPNVELVQNMMVSPAIKAQDHDPDAINGKTMRLPPEGTVARNYPRYRPANQAEAAKLKNPLAGRVEFLERGKDRYVIYCGVCHGNTGLGDGTVAPKMMLKPPSLVSEKMKAWKDGEIYHLITKGRGLMGAYGSQILPEDRWKIVNYIRELQKTSEK